MPRARILGRAVALPDLPWLGLEGAAGRAGGRTMMRAFHLSGRMRSPRFSPYRPFCPFWRWRDAKDLGVRGATWPIAEPDLLEQIEARLTAMQRSGELARIEREARSRARSGLEEPEPVPGIAPAREHRSRLFDPAIVVERDIRLPDGTLIAAAGTRVNPLASHALSARPAVRRRPPRCGNRLGTETLESREDRAARRAAPRPRQNPWAGLLLRPGRPSRDPVRARVSTPALVEQAGAQLRITEIPVEDRDASKPEQEE